MTQTQSNLLLVAAIVLAIISGLLAFHHQQPARANTRQHRTRIISWWGYFESKSKRQEIEALCNTELEVQEYRHVEGMKNLVALQPYDIYIYPWGYHKRIEPHFRQSGPRINWMVNDYHSAIKHKYAQYKVPDDTVFFQLAVQMYLYDKAYIPELEQLGVEDILSLASSGAGKVFMMDSRTHMNRFIKQFKNGTSAEHWRRLYQDFRLRRAWHQAHQSGFQFYNFASAYLDDRLILGALDSGELMNPHHDWSLIKDSSGQPKDLGMGVHPTLSQITADMLALKSQDSRALCVAHTLSSRDYLRWTAETNFYFSPFEERIDSHPKALQQLTQAFYDKAAELSWLYDEEAELLSPEAETIWNMMIACQYDEKHCKQWTAIGDRILVGSS